MITGIAIVSVLAGFVLFLSSYVSYVKGCRPKVTWTLFGIAVLCLTAIPVILAVFFASRGGA